MNAHQHYTPTNAKQVSVNELSAEKDNASQLLGELLRFVFVRLIPFLIICRLRMIGHSICNTGRAISYQFHMLGKFLRQKDTLIHAGAFGWSLAIVQAGVLTYAL